MMQLERKGAAPRNDQSKNQGDRRQSKEASDEAVEQDAQAGPCNEGNDRADDGREEGDRVLVSLHFFHYALSYRNLLSDYLRSTLAAIKIAIAPTKRMSAENGPGSP